MGRKFSTSLLLALTICSAKAEIDFTPGVNEYTSQGIVYRQVKLKTDTGSIAFVPPRGWSVRGTKDRLQMQPTNKDFAEATATAKPLQKPMPLDEATIETLKQEALSSAPGASTGPAAPQIVSCDQNSVMGQNPSLEIVVSYNALGRTFQRNVIYVHAPDTQLVFRFTAPKADFAGLNQAFRQSVNSWRWTENNADRPGAAQKPAPPPSPASD
jgi:hypothetical protein